MYVWALCSLIIVLHASCQSNSDDERPYPAAGAYGELMGPGGPQRTFSSDELDKTCAWVSGGPDDKTQHHNLVTMYDGLMLMPWAPESSLYGGLTFFDVSDPCQPKVVGTKTTDVMRETHSVGFSEIDGSWAVVNHGEVILGSERPFEGGVLFWDVSDPSQPVEAGLVKFPDFAYPDAYAFVVLSVFWQGNYVYAAMADGGIYIVDATDPKEPKIANRYLFDPILRAGQVIAVGNTLIVTAAEQARAVLLDITDPIHPKPIAGGDFVPVDSEGKPRKAYFSNLAAGHLFFTRKDNGGGLIVYDIREPTKPTYVSDIRTDGKGGYVFMKDHYAVAGESNHAVVFDISDLTDIKELNRLTMPGDLDTANPLGNIIVLSVDDKADLDNAAGSGIVPFLEEVDVKGPSVTWLHPSDGATELPTSTRFGLTISEPIEPKSAWTGSVRLYESEKGAAKGRVDGAINTQDLVINFTPNKSLKPNTKYTLELPAGGIADPNGNALEQTVKAEFTTGAL